MIVAGIDIGAATAKVVIADDAETLAYSIIPTGESVARAADKVMRQTLEKAGVAMARLEYIISTGYGRRAVKFANKTLTEIICHGAGVSSMFSEARTIIDIGGQDSKVIGLDDAGTVTSFVMNDKCAAGTGRFLEVMAGVLGVDISEMGPLSLKGANPCPVTSTCTVFAESEMISLRAEGRSREDIFAGIHAALAHRIFIMGKSVGFKPKIVFTGGVAKNTGMKKSLQEQIGLPLHVPEEPQIMGALGAAMLAKVELKKAKF